jgi:hypothetical protein
VVENVADGALRDLFGCEGDEALLAGVRRYASGVSAPAIWAGYAAAGVPMCLVAAGLPPGAVRRALDYRRAGHPLLLDSGAFIYRARPAALNWRAVLAIYLRLGRGPGARLGVILPDVVGDQAASIGLAGEHGPRLAALAAGGHETLVPMQRGPMPLAEYFDRYVAALAFRPSGLAIPSNASAMPVAELTGLRLIQGVPHRVHFLGISRRAKALAARVAALREFWANADISADACEHRAHVGQERSITQVRRRELHRLVDEARDQVDDTEDSAWDAAAAALRREFPDLDDDAFEDVLCSDWGVKSFCGELGARLAVENGPRATALSIEDFARKRFAA